MIIKSLKILFDHFGVSASASHDLAVAIGSMLNLTELTLDGPQVCQDEFFSEWKTMTSSMKVQSLTIKISSCPVSASTSNDLAAAVGAMPNLTKLTLNGLNWLHEKFLSKYRSLAPFVEVQSLTLGFQYYPVSVSASSHDLAEELASMPNLTDLTLDKVDGLNDEFFSDLKSMALSMKIQSFKFSVILIDISTSAHRDLALAVGNMPCLTELTVEGIRYLDEFYCTLEAMADSKMDCFPQITKGNFHFNGTHHESLESFMHDVSNRRRSYWNWEADKKDREKYVEEHLNDFPQRPSSNPLHGLRDPELQHPPASPDDDNNVQHSTPEGLTPILMHPGATLPSQPTIIEESSSVREAGNQDGGSDDNGCRDLLDTSLYPSESQECSQLPSLPAQVGDRPESFQPTHSMLSSPLHVPQSTVSQQHSCPQPLSVDKLAFLPITSPDRSEDPVLHQASGLRNRSGHGQQSPHTVGSSSGRSQSLMGTAQSRNPNDIPDELSRVDILEESPSVRLCDYSSSDESSTSEEI